MLLVFPHRKCYGPQNVCVLQNSVSCGLCVRVTEPTMRNGTVGQKNVFFKYVNFNSKLEFMSFFPGRFMNYQNF